MPLLEFRVHVVAGGDTLYGMSLRYGVSVEMIQEFNPRIDPRFLRIGAHLLIPVLPPRSNQMKKTLSAFLAALALALSPAAGAAPLISEEGFVVTTSIDWAAGSVAVEARKTLDPGTPSLVRAKGDAETFLESRMPDLLARAIGPLRVDSSHLFEDMLSADPGLLGKLNDIALPRTQSELFLTPDLTVLVARYAIPLFGAQGIAAPLFPADATPVRRWLGDVITRGYTGLLIFAQGMLPEAGHEPHAGRASRAVSAHLGRADEPRAGQGDVQPGGARPVGQGGLFPGHR